jgi:hypothetical protein
MPLLTAVLVPREAEAITLPPLILPHNGKVVLDNFTGMQAVNLSIDETGAASLKDSGRVWGAGIKPCIRLNYSTKADVAAGPDDRFVAAWSEYSGPATLTDIYASIFDAKGNIVKERFPVVVGPAYQTDPSVACGPDGGFMVGWFDARGGWYAVFGQRFDRNGNKVGAEMNISSESTNKGNLQLAANSRGDFILAWDESRQGDAQINARMFDRNGASLGDEILVVGGSEGHSYPAVAFDSQDRFAVAWANSGAQVCATVMFQRFDAAGVKLGTPVAPAVADYPRYSPFLAYDPQDNLVMAWNDYHVRGKYDYDIWAQRFDPTGARLGAEISLVSADGSQTTDAFAMDSKGRMMVAWSDNTTGAYQVYATLFDGRLFPTKTVVAPSSPHINETCMAMAVSANDHFMVLWIEHSWYGNYSYFEPYARPCLQTNVLAGTLATGALASPANLWRWDSLSADIKLGSASSNSVSFEYSVDGGANWTALPANGSLSGAGAAPFAIRAKLSSLDNLTTPVLRSITLAYKYNSAPAVRLPADMTVKKGAEVTITSNVTDPDMFDLFTLTYKWTQTAGKNLTLTNATGQNLSFKADKAGTFTFRLVANDGWNDSAPVTITVKVTEAKPAAKSGYGWALLAGLALAGAVFLRRRQA